MSRTLDMHAEQAILGGLMVWPGEFDRVGSVVTARDFASAGHQALFSAIASLALACKPIDVVTVYGEIQKLSGEGFTLPELNALAQGSASQRGMWRYAETVRAAALERRLLAATDQAGEIAEGEGEMAERLEGITSLFSGMAHASQSRMPRHVSEIAISRIDYYTDLSMGNVPAAWRTGLPTLDEKLSGGLRPGKVYVLAARPKVGKTSLAAQIALAAARDEALPTLILTQEMPDSEVVDRGVANLGRVGYSGLLTGKLDNEDWGRITEGIEILTQLPLWIDDQGGLTLSDIRAKARSVKGLKLLVIDYLQLCAGSKTARVANRNEEIGEISRGIKALAKELGCAVLLLSQLNRAVETRTDRRPNLSDLRDSGAIEQDADAIVFLWFVRMINGGHKLIGCDVAANRSGTTGEFALDFDGSQQRWQESFESIRVAAPSKPAARSTRGWDTEDDQ